MCAMANWLNDKVFKWTSDLMANRLTGQVWADRTTIAKHSKLDLLNVVIYEVFTS